MSTKGWVDQSEIDARLGYKIILAGLAEAGKTAVKRLFFLKHKTEDVDGLTATLSYERLAVTISKTPITILDLGGQRIFLKRFLTTFSPFIFNSVVTLVFLIDVSNRTARNNAVQYFKACLEKIEKYSPEAQIFVFLHKNDLVEHWPNYESIHEQLKEQFQIESKKQLRFFRTTIFNPKTVIDSFGRIIELSMPELAKSEYVNGQTIGRIEEIFEKYAEASETLTEVAAQIRKPTILKMSDTEQEDPTYLERIQSIMRGSIVDKTTKPGSPLSPLSEAITEEMVEETSLTHIIPSNDQQSVQNTAQ
ncbi:MAG: ADP-ribosylation factor-like protein, partial [Promethearchaeota archaeon]